MQWIRTRHGFALVLVAALVAGCPGSEESSAPVEPAGLPEAVPADLGGAVVSREGLYRVRLAPERGEARLGRMHAWTVAVETPDGQPVRPTRLVFGGGMPQHQHGFMSAPRVTRSLGDGRFLVEGVKFHMSGRWRLEVELVGPAGPDVAILFVDVAP